MEASSAARPRKRWLRPRFSLLAFLIVTTIIAVAVGPFIYRTRMQKRICEQLSQDDGITVAYFDPPSWLQRLPESWSNIADGHWWRQIQYVSIQHLGMGKPYYDCKSLKKQLQLASDLRELPTLIIDVSFQRNDSLSELSDALSVLPSIRGLTSLTFDEYKKCDLTLDALPKLPLLRKLDLANNNDPRILGKQSFAAVLKFPRLESLGISCPFVEDNDLSVLTKLSHLRELRAGRLSVWPSSVDCFTNHPTLEKLYVRSNFVTDKTLEILASCPNIKAVYADNSLVTDSGLASLKNLKNLEEVYFSHTSISDAGVAQLANCISLQAIRCRDCKLTDAIGPTLSQLPNLWSIDLVGTQTSGKLLASLSPLTKLQFLDVGKSRITVEELLSFVSRMPPDRVPNFGKSSWNYATNYFGNIPRTNIPLNYINLSEVSGIHGRLRPLGNTTGVSAVNLSGSDITDSDLSDVLTNVQYLSTIDISNTAITADALSLLKGKGISDLTAGPFKETDDVIAIVSKLLHVRSLTLYGRPLITHANTKLLGTSLLLEYLQFPDAPYDKTITAELSQLPNLINVRWHNAVQGSSELSAARLNAARDSQGESFSLQNYLAKYPQTEEVTVVDESELAQLKSIPLQSLNASGVPLSRPALTQIAKLKSLTNLDLSNTGITDEDLSALGSPMFLRAINLNHNPLTDASVDYLASLVDVWDIRLANTKLTDVGFSRVLQFPNVQFLDLSRTQVTHAAWSSLTNTTRICRNVSLDDVPNIKDIIENTPADLLPPSISYQLADQRPTIQADTSLALPLERIIFSQTLSTSSVEDVLSYKFPYHHIRTYGTHCLSSILSTADKQCKTLSSLSLNNEQLTSIPSISFPESLRNVEFFDCTLDTATIDLLAKCPWIRSLTLNQCNIEQCSLEALARMPLLYHLQISNTKLAPDQLQTLDRLKPNLQSHSNTGMFMMP